MNKNNKKLIGTYSLMIFILISLLIYNIIFTANLLFINVFLVASAIGISIPSMYIVNTIQKESNIDHREIESRRFYRKLNENNNKELEFVRIENLEKEITIALGNDELIEKLEGDLDFVSMLNLKDIQLTVIAKDFWDNVDQIPLEKNDKLEFIREMVSLSPVERQEIMGGILLLGL